MKKLLLFICIFCVTASAHAQRFPKVVKSKTVQTPVARPTPVSPYGGALGSQMGVNYHLIRAAATAMATPTHLATPAPTVVSQRSWPAQQLRNVKAWNLKRQRRQRDAKIEKEQLRLAEIELQKANLPKLQEEHAFTVQNFEDLVPAHNQQPKPEVPFVAESGTMAFRGMALAADGEAIKNILTNGLRIQDVGDENNTLRIAYASHGGYAAVKHMVDNPVINITYGPNSAAGWGARRLGEDLPILTLVQVKGEWAGNSLEVAVEDIPASQLETLAVRVNLNGNLTWCRVVLNADGTFTLTPYEARYPADK